MDNVQSLKQAMQPVSDDRFTITDDSGVVWALRKLKEIEAEHDNDAQMVEEAIKPEQQKIEQAKEWLAERDRKREESRQYFISLIREYTDPKQGEKAAYKLKTPLGNIAYVKKQPKFKHDDEALQRGYPDYSTTKITHGFDWAKFKKDMSLNKLPVKDGNLVDPETGEIIQGVEVEEPAHREFTIKPNKEAKQ
ncbi:host-nuclease inhibitor Gam family protein [Limosilactobacillus sp.]|uniref:host-nuclease inhibitor Gam family protein n=1 Tax=Limosilactobacillus sp. TaxID=2773925 RepID=UPI003EFCA293